MTYVDGIAAAQNIDSSGEIISIAGMDISSLAVDGVITYEHEIATNEKGEKINVKLPSQTVGKILKAKKIFSDADCEDERETYFWQKCQVPYIYVMGELFDDYTDAAKDLAGKFRYDSDKKAQNERSVMNFSIEGRYLSREGMLVTKSIARKCTITVHPCNKVAVAEMVPSNENKGSDLESLFKTESIEIEIYKVKELIKPDGPQDMKKHADILGLKPLAKNVIPFPKKPTVSGQAKAPSRLLYNDPSPSKTVHTGARLGQTLSGKSVFSHTKIHEYRGFSSKDHSEAANMHYDAAQKVSGHQASKHHLDKMKLHHQAAGTAEHKETRFQSGKQRMLGKSMTAGSSIGAPGELTGGAALGKESLENTGAKSWIVLNRKKWRKRAEEAYQKWEKREEFRSFMKERMPHLTKGEVDAIGETLALKKNIDAEDALGKLVPMAKSLKFGSEEDQKAVAASIAERAKNPAAKAEPKKKAPELKTETRSEVSHTTPYGDQHETLHLKSGHELHGVKKDRFKAGDKVVAKPHLMGTFVVDHDLSKAEEMPIMAKPKATRAPKDHITVHIPNDLHSELHARDVEGHHERVSEYSAGQMSLEDLGHHTALHDALLNAQHTPNGYKTHIPKASFHHFAQRVASIHDTELNPNEMDGNYDDPQRQIDARHQAEIFAKKHKIPLIRR